MWVCRQRRGEFFSSSVLRNKRQVREKSWNGREAAEGDRTPKSPSYYGSPTSLPSADNEMADLEHYHDENHTQVHHQQIYTKDPRITPFKRATTLFIDNRGQASQWAMQRGKSSNPWGVMVGTFSSLWFWSLMRFLSALFLFLYLVTTVPNGGSLQYFSSVGQLQRFIDEMSNFPRTLNSLKAFYVIFIESKRQDCLTTPSLSKGPLWVYARVKRRNGNVSILHTLFYFPRWKKKKEKRGPSAGLSLSQVEIKKDK